MKYFTVNKEPYHCDDIFNWVTTDKDGSVCVSEGRPTLYRGRGFWDAYNMFAVQDIPKFSSSTPWTQSCSRLT